VKHWVHYSATSSVQWEMGSGCCSGKRSALGDALDEAAALGLASGLHAGEAGFFTGHVSPSTGDRLGEELESCWEGSGRGRAAGRRYHWKPLGVELGFALEPTGWAQH
jgi:hypothetical protein